MAKEYFMDNNDTMTNAPELTQAGESYVGSTSDTWFDRSAPSDIPSTPDRRAKQMQNKGDNAFTAIAEDDGATIVAVRENEKEDTFRPVVGWLVCTAGPDRGKAFELYDGDNYIGRSDGRNKLDVMLSDKKVSRKPSAEVHYAKRVRKFTFARMQGVNVECYFNRTEPIIQAQVSLKYLDTVMIGDTELMLIPLCGDDFDWNMTTD